MLLSTESEFSFFSKAKNNSNKTFYFYQPNGFFSQWEHANFSYAQWAKRLSSIGATLESPLARCRAPIVSTKALTFWGPTRCLGIICRNRDWRIVFSSTVSPMIQLKSKCFILSQSISFHFSHLPYICYNCSVIRISFSSISDFRGCPFSRTRNKLIDWVVLAIARSTLRAFWNQ